MIPTVYRTQDIIHNRKAPRRGQSCHYSRTYAVVVDEDDVVVEDDEVVDVDVEVVEDDVDVVDDDVVDVDVVDVDDEVVEDVVEDEDEEVVVVDVDVDVVVDVEDEDEVVDDDVDVVDDDVVDVDVVEVEDVVDVDVVVEVELEVVVKLKFDFCRFPQRNSAIRLRKFSYYTLHSTARSAVLNGTKEYCYIITDRFNKDTTVRGDLVIPMCGRCRSGKRTIRVPVYVPNCQTNRTSALRLDLDPLPPSLVR